MFEQKKFSEILTKIAEIYGSTVSFAASANVGRSYLSKYINMKIPSPPTPKVLEKISNASRGVTNYDELMCICGYYNFANSEQIIATKYFNENLSLLEKYHLSESDIYRLKEILIDRNEKQSSIPSQINSYAEYVSISEFDNNLTIKDLYYDLIKINNEISSKLADMRNSLQGNNLDYFEFISEDDAMYPLLDIGDKAIIFKQNTIDEIKGKNKGTYLIELNNKKTIRKIVLSEDEEYYQLIGMNSYCKTIDISKELIGEQIKILGKVVEAKNKSAFK